MKKYFKLYITMMAMGVSLLTSCIKDDGQLTRDGNGGDNGIVELAELTPRASATAYASTTVAFEALPEVDVPILVNYTGVNGAPSDVTVTWDFDDAAVTALAATNTPLPANLYSVPSKTITFAKGQKTATIIVKVKAAQFDFSKKYAMGIAIKSSTKGIVSGNYGTGVIYVNAKNKYDGIYSFEAGSVINRYTNGSLNTGDNLMGSLVGQANRTLTTADGNTLNFTPIWANGGGLAGLDNLQIRVEANNELTYLTTTTTANITKLPGLDNKYDPATKTFSINFKWGAAATERDMRIKLKFVGPR